MKIAIISDTHNNLANFKKVIDWLNKEKIKILLHCGDISTQDIIDEIGKLFEGEIKFTRGNADFNLENIPESDEIELGRKKIAFCHTPETARKLAETNKYNLVFYGHTHRPWEERVADCRLINPGEVAGQFYKPTFAVYDTEKDLLELKILETLH
jgi:hypothetical protein